MTDDNSLNHTYTAEEAHDGKRLDAFLAAVIEDASRSLLKQVIKDQNVTINGEPIQRPSRKIRTGDEVNITLPPPPTSHLVPEDIPLEVLFEDEHVLMINKPSGLVVHPAPGHYTGTLVQAVLNHCPKFESPSGDLSGYGVDPMRPGIVHRLDRYTSGVMVVAKTQIAFNHLARQASEHTFDRHYLALVRDEFQEDSGVINAPIGRSLSQRGKMAVTSVKGRDAITHFEVKERFGIASLIKLRLETGRTHQIRVHTRFAGRPILGDPLYGITDYAKWDVKISLRTALKALEGQALHAELLGIEHPITGERIIRTALTPPDFQEVHDLLKQRSTENS